jgi:hypothetical protein
MTPPKPSGGTSSAMMRQTQGVARDEILMSLAL